jgi:putative ABC transport system permease protein
MARLLYGSDNPIGKTMKIDTWIDVTIASVFKDVPASSSLQFDFAMPYSIVIKLWRGNKERFAENFFETYVKSNTDVSAKLLTDKLNAACNAIEASVYQLIFPDKQTLRPHLFNLTLLY